MTQVNIKASALYEEFLTVKLNQEYYARRLAAVKKKNRLLDIYLALFAGSSGIAAFGIWQIQIGTVEAGKVLFAALAGVGLVIGILKPYLKYDDEIERLASIEGTYPTLGHQLEDMITTLNADNGTSEDFEERFVMARSIRGSQEAKEDKPTDQELAKECQTLIRQRHSDKITALDNLKQSRR